MLRKGALLLLSSVLVMSSAFAQESRHFTFRYAFTVKNVPAGERVRVWMPMAHSDLFQDVKVLSANGDLPLKKTRESRFGNEMYYAETSKASAAELHFEVAYDVVRQERMVLGRQIPHLEAVMLNPKERKEDLQPDKLVPITGLPAELAAKVTAGANTPLDKASAIYDYVFSTMKYDKTGTGWGRGDVLYACDAKKGNCTDFHSLFISMARSQGIPARFEIGFPLPTDKHEGEIAGYHCWADFFEPKDGWVPVDISEARKHPEKKTYFFGAHDDNRVQFSMGRDLVLSPKQDGEPLNYFIYSYVEVGGKVYPNISMTFSFADVGWRRRGERPAAMGINHRGHREAQGIRVLLLKQRGAASRLSLQSADRVSGLSFRAQREICFFLPPGKTADSSHVLARSARYERLGMTRWMALPAVRGTASRLPL